VSGPQPSLVDQVDALADRISHFINDAPFDAIPYAELDYLMDIQATLKSYGNLLLLNQKEQAAYVSRFVTKNEDMLAQLKLELEAREQDGS